MAIFLFVPASGHDALNGALTSLQAENRLDFIKLPKEGIFISFHGTAQELSNILGVTDGSNGTGVIVGVSSYYGRGPTNIWDWISSRWES